MKCWELRARERPKFAQLVQQLNCLLEQEAGCLDLTTSLITATPLSGCAVESAEKALT